MLLLTLIILISHTVVFTQSVINGLILDAQTNKPLAAANIQISGTYRGTITNEDGIFVLAIEGEQADLLISYIGYESKTLRVTRNDLKRKLTILLSPIILEGETITVIAEDPGMQIMREVIKRKLEWRDKLQTYRANAYSRVVLENDSAASMLHGISFLPSPH